MPKVPMARGEIVALRANVKGKTRDQGPGGRIQGSVVRDPGISEKNDLLWAPGRNRKPLAED